MIKTYSIGYCDFKKIAESGQCFRMREVGANKYLIISKDKYAYGYNDASNAYLECDEKDIDYWWGYFDLGTAYDAVSQYFILSCDNPFVKESVDFCKGLRLLKQDPFETLISFIISQRKNIPSIMACVESLCALYGHTIAEGIKSFPTAKELEGKDLSKVKGIGYRDVYVENAVVYCNGWLNLTKLGDYGYVTAREKLKEIYGVGDKVANCVCLYGLGYRNAFPIDVWVQRIIDEDFNGNFPYGSFNRDLGILQLFMFYYKRKGV